MSLATIVARIVWVFPATYLPRRLSAKVRERDPYPAARNVFLLSWAGMRGVVSLAAALALPMTLPSGEPFPERNLLIFLTFAVILATLVGQGLSLPLIIRRLGIVADGGVAYEEADVRRYLAEAAVERIGRLENRWSDHRDLIDQLRAQYRHRAEHLEVDEQDRPTSEAEQELLEHRGIRLAVIDAEREALIRMRDGAHCRTRSSAGWNGTSTSRSSGWRRDPASGSARGARQGTQRASWIAAGRSTVAVAPSLARTSTSRSVSVGVSAA